MFQGEHSAILFAFIKLPFVIKIFVLSIFEWTFYIGFTVRRRLSFLICFCSHGSNQSKVGLWFRGFMPGAQEG